MTRSLHVPRPLAALLLLGAMIGGSSVALAQGAAGSAFTSSQTASASTPAAFGGANLILDDGVPENSIGVANAPMIWCNRFTPPANDFPISLVSAEFLFDAAGNFSGTYDIFVYSDADGNPANGATYVGGSTGQTATNNNTFQTTTFAAPLEIATVGDVLICGRATGPTGVWPASIDQTASQGRSWAGFGAGADASPVVLPPATWGTIDGFGFPGNWMIRGTYTTEGGGPGPGPGGDPVTISSTDTPMAIPDGPGVPTTCGSPGAPAVSTINVAGIAGDVVDLDVSVNISHTWIGDIEATLAKGATSVVVIDNPGAGTPTACGNSTDNIVVTLDDDAANSVQSGPFPLNGTYRPANALSAFNGTEINGTWTLSVTDGGAGDTGSLNSWALIVTPSATTTPSSISMVTVRQPAGPLPAAGGDARIAFRFTNLTDEPIATTTWAQIQIPGGGLVSIPGDVSRLDTPRPLELDAAGTPGDNRRWGIRFVLLPEAPAGEYQYTRFAGTQGGEVFVSETVSFFKSAAARVATSEAPEAGEVVVTIGADGVISVVEPETTQAVATRSDAVLRVSPNPVTTQGQAVLSVSSAQDMRVALYDALGREVRVLLDRSMTAGQQAHIGFRTDDLPAGVYVLRAVGTDVSLTERVTVVR